MQRKSWAMDIVLENAAFEGAPQLEVARILRALADRLEARKLDEPGKVYDVNGNAVGTYGFTGGFVDLEDDEE